MQRLFGGNGGGAPGRGSGYGYGWWHCEHVGGSGILSGGTSWSPWCGGIGAGEGGGTDGPGVGLPLDSCVSYAASGSTQAARVNAAALTARIAIHRVMTSATANRRPAPPRTPSRG